MQGNGGTMSGKAAADYAVQTVMSGPAAGALAAARIGEQAGHPQPDRLRHGRHQLRCDADPRRRARSVGGKGHRLRRADPRADDRHPHDRRRRRLDRAHHQGRASCRSAPTAPAPIPARSATAAAAPSRPSPTPTSCWASSIPPHCRASRAACRLRRCGPRSSTRSAARWGSTPSRRRLPSSPSPAIIWRAPSAWCRSRKATIRATSRSSRLAARGRCMPWPWRASSACRLCWYRAFPASPRRWAASWPTSGTISCARLTGR